MKIVSSQFIHDIFYSGQFGFSGDKEVINKIAFLVNNNYMRLSQVIIASKENYLEISSNASHIAQHDEASGGSLEHVALKLLTQGYIKSKYDINSVFEQPFVGFILDVQSINRDIICECGHTSNPEKIFTYLRHAEVVRVIQIPYPLDTDDTVFGYEFQANQNLIPFLDYETQETNQSLKRIINNR